MSEAALKILLTVFLMISIVGVAVCVALVIHDPSASLYACLTATVGFTIMNSITWFRATR